MLLYTNTATGMVFFGAGDLVVQKFIDKRKLSEIDTKRVGTCESVIFCKSFLFCLPFPGISCVAGSFMGYFGHFWYGYLDKSFPGRSSSAVIRKLLFEMVIGPPFAASMFLLVGTLEGKSLSKIWADTKDSLVYLVLADWGFYIPMQYFNFHYLKARYRVLYVALISIVYDSALVYLLHKVRSWWASRGCLIANSLTLALSSTTQNDIKPDQQVSTDLLASKALAILSDQAVPVVSPPAKPSP